MLGTQKQETMNRRRDLAIAVLIIATTLVVYGQVRHYEFVRS